jgi:ribonuclease E
MTDETTPEATASDPNPSESKPSTPEAHNNGESSEDAPRPRRRRRGSRGGRNRRKPKQAPETAAAGDETDEVRDFTDSLADDGLTADDVAEEAKEDAGLKPKIGDTRPAPAPAEPKAPRRRRRRGGRGRGRGGGSEAPAADLDDVVHADLGTGETLDLDDLDDETLARRRGRTRKGRPAGRYLMCVHVRPDGHNHIALLEGRVLVEHSVSTARDSDLSIDGNIYLGRVQNVLPGMEAAFIDIGTPKNGVLYRGDVAYDPDEVEKKQPRIEQLLRNGQSITVQVTKNPIGAKGARLTQEVSLAGRFVVMVPGQPDTYGISKRLPDDERRRLRRVLEGLRPPDAGLIVRTAAEGAATEELERDVRRLGEQWAQISALAERSKPGRLLYQEPPLVLRLLREEFTKEYRGVIIDDRALYEEVRAYVEAVAPELADRVEHYDVEDEGISLFERHHVQEQLLKALDRKVWLPSGGSVVIERTEALTVVDVNTGKNVGKSNLEETVFRNNLEAADEIARQLRLRDIGGIIVIDFIDMEIKANREAVVRAFRDALARDKTRTQVFDISELGIVEMTRKRVSEGLIESVSEVCPQCSGRGYLLDEALLEELQ